MLCTLAGFSHSAYVLGLESHVVEAGIDGGAIPPAALLTLLQKGIHYTEAELCAVGDDGVERTLVEPLSLVEAVMPEMVANKVREHVYNILHSTAIVFDLAKTKLAIILYPCT